jgi:hypothetical protein
MNTSEEEDPHSSEAVRKINSEMLQLDNQRFLLTTTAVLFVGTAAGWTTTTLLRAGNTGSAQPLVLFVPPAVVLLIWIVLGVLFYYQSSLARTVRWLAAYQMHRGSDWEWTWHAFRLQDSIPHCRQPRERPFAAYKVIATVFIFLFVTSYLYFLLLQFAIIPKENWTRPPSSVLILWGGLSALLILLVGGTIVLSEAVSSPRMAVEEIKYRKRWRLAAVAGRAMRGDEYPKGTCS